MVDLELCRKLAAHLYGNEWTNIEEGESLDFLAESIKGFLDNHMATPPPESNRGGDSAHPEAKGTAAGLVIEDWDFILDLLREEIARQKKADAARHPYSQDRLETAENILATLKGEAPPESPLTEDESYALQMHGGDVQPPEPPTGHCTERMADMAKAAGFTVPGAQVEDKPTPEADRLLLLEKAIVWVLGYHVEGLPDFTGGGAMPWRTQLREIVEYVGGWKDPAPEVDSPDDDALHGHASWCEARSSGLACNCNPLRATPVAKTPEAQPGAGDTAEAGEEMFSGEDYAFPDSVDIAFGPLGGVMLAAPSDIPRKTYYLINRRPPGSTDGGKA